MRILVALPYGPSQTRVRSRMLLNELAQRHQFTLVALCWNSEDQGAVEAYRDHGLEVHAVPHGKLTRARALAGDPRRPLQQIAATSDAFARLVRQLIADHARDGQPYDAAHVEHLRGAAAVRLTDRLGVRTVFDAVDCIAELALLARQTGPNRMVRLLARYEEANTRRLEAACVAAADVVTVVAERDRAALLRGGAPDRVEVVPNGVPARPRPVTLTVEPVAIFTGKLSYHANQAAARWLLTEVWPRIRAATPNARLIIAGADPPPWLQRAHGWIGVEVIANPPSLAPLIERARVALAPIVYSVGIQNKVLEAMACGLPVVATPSAAGGLLPEGATALALAEDRARFAIETARLFEDADRAALLGRAGYSYVCRHHQWSAVADHFERLYAGGQIEARAA